MEVVLLSKIGNPLEDENDNFQNRSHVPSFVFIGVHSWLTSFGEVGSPQE